MAVKESIGMVRGETKSVIFCLVDGLTVTHAAKALESSFSVQYFSDKDNKDTDILIIGKKK